MCRTYHMLATQQFSFTMLHSTAQCCTHNQYCTQCCTVVCVHVHHCKTAAEAAPSTAKKYMPQQQLTPFISQAVSHAYASLSQ
jgi:hypothetical protein